MQYFDMQSIPIPPGANHQEATYARPCTTNNTMKNSSRCFKDGVACGSGLCGASTQQNHTTAAVTNFGYQDIASPPIGHKPHQNSQPVSRVSLQNNRNISPVHQTVKEIVPAAAVSAPVPQQAVLANDNPPAPPPRRANDARAPPSVSRKPPSALANSIALSHLPMLPLSSSDEPLKIRDHSFLHIFSMFTAALCFCFMMVFLSRGFGIKFGVFTNETVSLNQRFHLDDYRLEVTPAEGMFYVTLFIYVWQCVWILYGLSLICRRTQHGYMYNAFPIMPSILYVVFSFALACNISWLLIWDREYMEVALVFINLMTCNLYICLVVSLRRLGECGGMMAKLGLHRDIWLIRIFVHNGLAIFATWGAIAAMFNFAVVLTYKTGATEGVGSTVSLAIFILEILSWWIFDNFVFEKLLRYLYTPYIMILVALTGILYNNWNLEEKNCILTLTILVLVSILAIVKIALSVYRHHKYPLFIAKPKYRRPLISFERHSLLDT